MEGGVRRHPRLEAMDEGRPYRRVKVIMGRRQRCSYTAEEKARIVAESAAPGVNCASAWNSRPVSGVIGVQNPATS